MISCTPIGIQIFPEEESASSNTLRCLKFETQLISISRHIAYSLCIEYVISSMKGMRGLYPSSHPYIVNTPPFINHPNHSQQILEAILSGINREATAIDLYQRLAEAAPDHQQKRKLHQTLEDKKAHFHRLAELYTSWTGRTPRYDIDKITFHSYQEGLQKACQKAAEDYEEYRKHLFLTQHSPFQGVFWNACHKEAKHANQLHIFSLNGEPSRKQDHGQKPFVININRAAKENNTYRTAIWTGKHLQVTLMSIDVGDDIGLEVHPDVDQFLRLEAGQGMVQMGTSREQLDFRARVSDDDAIMVPAGIWHNLINTGNQPLKLYSIYAPPEHPFGTVHRTKADAMKEEETEAHPY